MHFRRFISKNALAKALNLCLNLNSISLSKIASKRLSEDMLNELRVRSISIIVSKNRGRKPKYAPVAQLGRAAGLYAPKLVSVEKSAGCRFNSGLELARVAQLEERQSSIAKVPLCGTDCVSKLEVVGANPSSGFEV